MSPDSLSAGDLQAVYRDPSRWEPLHEDLREAMVEIENMRFIHHPLLVTPYPDDGTNPSPAAVALNHAYEVARREMNRALIQKRWDRVIFSLVARPYRTEFFDSLAPRMTDRQYWEMLGELWTDQENPEDFVDEWVERFGSTRPQRRHLMTREERAAFKELPDPIVVYRADIGAEPWGPSWTTNKKTAMWFAGRFDRENPATLYRGVVTREKVAAFFTRRGEDEILVLEPGAVHDIETIEGEG